MTNSTPSANSKLASLTLVDETIAISNNVGAVKYDVCTRLQALVKERHFPLVDGRRGMREAQGLPPSAIQLEGP